MVCDLPGKALEFPLGPPALCWLSVWRMADEPKHQIPNEWPAWFQTDVCATASVSQILSHMGILIKMHFLVRRAWEGPKIQFINTLPGEADAVGSLSSFSVARI